MFFFKIYDKFRLGETHPYASSDRTTTSISVNGRSDHLCQPPLAKPQHRKTS